MMTGIVLFVFPKFSSTAVIVKVFINENVKLTLDTQFFVTYSFLTEITLTPPFP